MVAMARAAVCLCLWLAVCQVRGSYTPLKMNRTIQNLLQHYKIPSKERFNGKPVFAREPPSGKIEEKMVYMSGILEVYEKLIGHMLKQLPAPSPKVAAKAGDRATVAVTPAAGTGAGDAAVGANGDVREQLSYILDKVRTLRQCHYKEQDQFLQALQALRHVQMDNSVVQSKALGELLWLYEEASSLPDNLERQKEKRRRRRQAQRVKTRLRA